MTILLDENLPFGLRGLLQAHSVTTARDAGYAGLENGQLLAAIEGVYDILLTADKNLRYQQNLTARRLAIVELPTNRWPVLRSLQAEIIQAIERCQSMNYVVVAGLPG